MADKAHPTSTTPKIKPRVVTDNRPARSQEMIERIVDYGVPRARAATFPLTPHPATKRWCKKIKTPHGSKVFYFGPLADWKAALDRYNAERDDLAKGRRGARRRRAGALRLVDLLNQFLHFKRGLVDTGELAMRSWYDYQKCGERLIEVFGKECMVEDLGPQDFEALRVDYGRTWGPHRIGREVRQTRMVFRYAFEAGLIDTPVRFGPTFKQPPKKTLRKVRAKAQQQHGLRMFSAGELHVILDKAPLPMKAMVLLGINGGLNNADVANIAQDAVDLEQGLVNFPRLKTGVPRVIPLWPETIAAVREWLSVRKPPKDPADAHLLFLTLQRRPWYRRGRFVESEDATVVKGIDNPVSKSFRKLLDKLGINGRRNFLALRHGFRTIGRGARDREAIDAIMGHVDESMAGLYIEDGLPLERLRTVTDFVRGWLFAKPQSA